MQRRASEVSGGLEVYLMETAMVFGLAGVSCVRLSLAESHSEV